MALPRKFCTLAVLMPLLLRVPAASVTRLASAVPAPTAPVKVVAPPVLTVSACAPAVLPFTVELNTMAPLPLLVNTVLPPRVTAPA